MDREGRSIEYVGLGRILRTDNRRKEEVSVSVLGDLHEDLMY